jgi:hypothetical protein
MEPCITSLAYIQKPLKGAKDNNQSSSYYSRYSKSFSNSVPELVMKSKYSFLNMSPQKITSQVNNSFLSAGDPKVL